MAASKLIQFRGNDDDRARIERLTQIQTQLSGGIEPTVSDLIRLALRRLEEQLTQPGPKKPGKKNLESV